MPLAMLRWTSGAPLQMAAAAMLLYFASRAAVDSLTRIEHPSGERMALGHWMPIALTAILSASTGHSEIAVAIVFATSVAILSLVFGLLIFLAAPAVDSPSGTRAWPFVAPMALLTLIGGFRGALGLLPAAMLLAIAVMVALIWFAPAPHEAH